MGTDITPMPCHAPKAINGAFQPGLACSSFPSWDVQNVLRCMLHARHRASLACSKLPAIGVGLNP